MLGKISKAIYSHFIVLVLSMAFIIAYNYIVVSNASYGGIIFFWQN